MMAVVLAGGKGARLRPLTVSIPKPLLPLDDVPILDVVLRQLSRAGIRRVAVTLGYLPHLFEACIGSGERQGVQLGPTTSASRSVPPDPCVLSSGPLKHCW